MKSNNNREAGGARGVCGGGNGLVSSGVPGAASCLHTSISAAKAPV